MKFIFMGVNFYFLGRMKRESRGTFAYQLLIINNFLNHLSHKMYLAPLTHNRF